jgi:hypothetical protein
MKQKCRAMACVALLGVATAYYSATCVSRSDKSILRAEFDVPSAARVLSYRAHPDGMASWGPFGREGLEIDLVFQFSDQDYAEYVARAKDLGTWRPLPIPRHFLLRMGAIPFSQEGAARSDTWNGAPLSGEDPIHTAYVEKTLACFVESLPPMPKEGMFQCRSAGTDIMHAPKTVHTHLDKYLDDFMLGVLDHEQKRLIIKVLTRY